MNNKKENRGGFRANAGRKPSKYKSKPISFRVRLELIEDVKKLVKDYVEERIKGDA